MDARQATAASYVASLKARRDQPPRSSVRASRCAPTCCASSWRCPRPKRRSAASLASARWPPAARPGHRPGRPGGGGGRRAAADLPGDGRAAGIAALAARIEATGHREDAALGELLPRLEAYGRYTAASTDLDDRAWLEGGGADVDPWRPGRAAPARTPPRRGQGAAGRGGRSGPGHRHGAGRRRGRLLADALDQQAVAAEAIVEAEESLRLEQARYDDARATLTELLAAEATIRDRRTRLALAGLAAIRAQVQLALATGALQPDDLQGGSADPRGKNAPEGGEG
ncbi:MAG: hypothetical protein R3F43_20775 [bacterium]